MNINAFIKKYSLSQDEITQLSEYISNRYEKCDEITSPDTSFIKPWEKLVLLSASIGTDIVINKTLCPNNPIRFKVRENVRLEIYNSFAGPIPIFYADNPQDFEALVTNIAYKGKRPVNISKTGASFVSGKTTRFMILSSKPYSNVYASELGINEHNWKEKSLIIRRSHECTHYFTKQIYGISNNILHDELMADYIGIYDAFGFYKAEWFLRFMGVIKGNGQRIDVYTEDLSEKVRMAVIDILVKSAEKLEKWSLSEQFKSLTTADRIKIMCKNGLI